jgi:hypothetical protein
MYREDVFYADRQFVYWSTHLDGGNKHEFEKCSDRFRRLFPNYIFDSTMHIRAAPTAKTLNLKELRRLFNSKDADLWEENRWIFDGERRYLDGTQNKSNKIGFQSFPRSGNTFLRKYCELLTGVETGGDNTLNVNVHLQMQGLKGEHIVDDTVWIVKTHSPWIMPDAPVFHCNKMIVIVRNPLDVIISFLHLFSLGNHVQKAPFEYHERHPKWWDNWVRFCGRRLAKWYRTLMLDAKLKRLPVLFLRFEDMVDDPQPSLENIMKFACNTTDIQGTNAARRVDEVIAKGKDATVLYKLKDNTRKMNTNLSRYTKLQLEWLREEMKDIIYYFGYAKIPEDPDNKTGFFEYEHSDPEMLKQYYGYAQLTQHSIEWNASMTDEEREQIQFMNSDPEKSAELCTYAETAMMAECVIHDAELRLYGTASKVIE